jgi:major membrane immunogen (membrane-anchored lipoprotein)
MLSRLVLIVSLLLLSACSEEQQNKLTRLGVTWLEGDYRVTYADGEHVKNWVVMDGKVTTEPAKGYYYFWAKKNGKKYYVQTPIARTYIEEIEN